MLILNEINSIHSHTHTTAYIKFESEHHSCLHDHRLAEWIYNEKCPEIITRKIRTNVRERHTQIKFSDKWINLSDETQLKSERRNDCHYYYCSVVFRCCSSFSMLNVSKQNHHLFCAHTAHTHTHNSSFGTIHETHDGTGIPFNSNWLRAWRGAFYGITMSQNEI